MASGPLRIEVTCDPRICYAMQQNGVTWLQGVRLVNDGTDALRDLEVTVALLPGFAAPRPARVAALPPGEALLIDRLEPELRAETLANLVERQRANLRIEVADAQGRLAALDHPLEVLAYNEWPGLGSLSELLAAFVLPNHPALAPLLRAACRPRRVAAASTATRRRIRNACSRRSRPCMPRSPSTGSPT
jgi:hypothetical protein